jgi:hypothetical protein
VKQVLFRAMLLTSAAAAWIISVPSNTHAATQACSLLTNVEVAKIIGRRLFDDPDETALAGGSACTYGGGEAQIILFSGGNSEERFNSLLKGFGNENEPKQPVSGIGDSAYVMYPKPRNQYQDTIGLLAVRAGQHTLGITVAVEKSQPATSVQPLLNALAAAVLAKLR